MSATSHTTLVNAPVETIWQLLLDKVEHPDKYINGVTDVEVEPGREGVTIRRMTLPTGKRITEAITADERTRVVVFKSIGDPDAVALVTNTIFEEDGEVFLNFTYSGAPRAGAAPANMIEMIHAAVEHTRGLAEGR